MNIKNPLILATALSLPIANATENVVDTTCVNIYSIIHDMEFNNWNNWNNWIFTRANIEWVKNDLTYYQWSVDKELCWYYKGDDSIEVIYNNDGSISIIKIWNNKFVIKK